MLRRRRVGRWAPRVGTRAEGDGGAAIVEMTFVGIILVLLLMGIIAYGFLMGFKQNMVQAAAEGARRGAVAKYSNLDPSDEALKGVKDAVSAFNQSCNGSSLTCAAAVATCTNKTSANCVTVTLTYDYKNFPLLPSVPLLDGMLPNTITTKSVAEVDGP